MDNVTFPEVPENLVAPSLEQSVARIAAAYERMAKAAEAQLQVSRENLEVQKRLADDSEALRAQLKE